MTNPWLNHPDILAAVDTVKAGGVIAYPTEGVWGLGCLPENEQAVNRILAMKNRSVEKGLILVAADINQVIPWLDTLDSAQLGLLSETWPGPNTWLVPHANKVPAWITGAHEKVALRVSAHPIVQALCSLLNSTLVSTSANPQGAPAALSAMEVSAYFGADIEAIAPGDLTSPGRPSVIRDLLTGDEIRPA